MFLVHFIKGKERIDHIGTIKLTKYLFHKK